MSSCPSLASITENPARRRIAAISARESSSSSASSALTSLDAHARGGRSGDRFRKFFMGLGASRLKNRARIVGVAIGRQRERENGALAWFAGEPNGATVGIDHSLGDIEAQPKTALPRSRGAEKAGKYVRRL